MYSRAMIGGNSRVELFAHHVEKYTADPKSTARKYAAVHEIAVAHGFLAPRVLELRSDRILLERMPDMQPLEGLYLSGERQALDTAIRRTGEVLACLHANLPAADVVTWSPPPGFEASLERYLKRSIVLRDLPHATLHGDYSFANVWLTRDSPQSVVVIDPCANYGSTFDDWTVAPVYIDVGKMLACLEGQIPLRQQHRRPTCARVNELQRQFVEGYERYGPRLDMETAHAFAFAVSSAQFHRRFGGLAALRRFALYNRLRGNFPHARKQRCAS